MKNIVIFLLREKNSQMLPSIHLAADLFFIIIIIIGNDMAMTATSTPAPVIFSERYSPYTCTTWNAQQETAKYDCGILRIFSPKAYEPPIHHQAHLQFTFVSWRKCSRFLSLNTYFL